MNVHGALNHCVRRREHEVFRISSRASGSSAVKTSEISCNGREATATLSNLNGANGISDMTDKAAR
jgi:hypothetical protein